jgi:hypothetical protein
MARERQHQQRQHQQQQQRLADWQQDHPDATPYCCWPDYAHHYRERVFRTLAQTALPPFTYTTNVKDKPKPITTEDIAIALFAVNQVGQRGLSYGQLHSAYMVATKTKAHRAKCATVLGALVTLGLIYRIAGHSQGRHGVRYRIVRESVNDLDFSFLKADSPDDDRA